ncbi:hypothetical protein CsSME_00014290 [Camellia sinensis var. sinensis]
MGHQNAFMNALWLSLIGHQNAFTAVPSWAIEFVNANGCATYYNVKCMAFEYEYDYVYESASALTSDYVQDSVSRPMTRPKLLPEKFGLRANYNPKPTGTGLGHDRVVSEYELYPMENVRSDDTAGSSKAHMSRMEQMLAALTESLRQQSMPHSSPSIPNELDNNDIINLTQKFIKIKPPTFLGGIEPLKAET